MRMKHINTMNRYFLIALIIFVNLFCVKLTNAIGGDDLRTHRDSGVIGEKKTIQKAEVHRYKNTGITYQVHKSGSFVTPIAIGDTAYFNLNYDYSFHFKCLKWKYDIKAYWSSSDVTEERVGFSVSLESPDKETLIDLKEVDIPVSSPLSPAPTQEQLDNIQLKGYVEDTFIGDERILAAQQAVKWILDKGLDGYSVMTDTPIKFTLEQIGDKEFVVTEIDVFSKKQNVTKKCVIWALNIRGYRFKSKMNNENVRRMYTWICQVITDSSNYLDAVEKTRMILETLDFNPARNVFMNTKE